MPGTLYTPDYRDKLDEIPAKPSQRQMNLITESAEHEVAVIKTELAAKSSELTVANGTTAELETKAGLYKVPYKLIFFPIHLILNPPFPISHLIFFPTALIS